MIEVSLIFFMNLHRRKTDVESSVMERETKRLQDLESAVFNEFRKDVRKRLRRNSRSGRSIHSKVADSDRGKTHGRKAVSEKVRGSRTRSRVRRQVSSDQEDVESEMVEMGSPRRPERFSTSDAPLITCEDESENSIFGRYSPSLPDIINVGNSAAKSIHEDTLPLRSMLHQEGEETGGPRVTFRTPSESDYESGSSQKSFATQHQSQQQQTQQNLDFELDLAVEIDSGQCVFHPADEGEKDDTAESKYVISHLPKTPAYKQHSQISSIPRLANESLEKLVAGFLAWIYIPAQDQWPEPFSSK